MRTGINLRSRVTGDVRELGAYVDPLDGLVKMVLYSIGYGDFADDPGLTLPGWVVLRDWEVAR